jgi:ribonuclease HI
VHANAWFDGACSGNPGPMGAGAVVDIGNEHKVLSLSMGMGTNNEAEYHGVLLAVSHALAGGATTLTLHGDSELVIRQLQGTYTVRAPKLKPLHEDALKLLARFEAVKLEWVPRHANEEADQAARAGLAKGSRTS